MNTNANLLNQHSRSATLLVAYAHDHNGHSLFDSSLLSLSLHS